MREFQLSVLSLDECNYVLKIQIMKKNNSCFLVALTFLARPGANLAAVHFPCAQARWLQGCSDLLAMGHTYVQQYGDA